MSDRLKCVFKREQKTSGKDGAVTRCCGRLFQMRAAETGKAQ